MKDAYATERQGDIAKLGLSAGVVEKLGRMDVTSRKALVEKTETELRRAGLTVRELSLVKSRLSLEGMALAARATSNVEDESDGRARGVEVALTLLDVPVDVCVAGDDAIGELQSDLRGDFAAREVFGIDMDIRPKAAKPVATGGERRQLTDDSRAKLRAASAHATATDLNRDQRIEALRTTRFMSVEDAAYVYAISRGSAYAACKTGEIPVKRIGRSIRVITEKVFAEIDGGKRV